MTEQAIIMIAQVLLQYGPEAARALHDIFTTSAPTAQQWETLFAQVKPYSAYIPGTTTVSKPIGG
jgi:hypothetical protein